MSRIYIGRQILSRGCLLHWLQTEIKITVPYLLTTVLIFHTVHLILYGIYQANFLFDPPMHKLTKVYHPDCDIHIFIQINQVLATTKYTYTYCLNRTAYVHTCIAIKF